MQCITRIYRHSTTNQPTLSKEKPFKKWYCIKGKIGRGVARSDSKRDAPSLTGWVCSRSHRYIKKKSHLKKMNRKL